MHRIELDERGYYKKVVRDIARRRAGNSLRFVQMNIIFRETFYI